MDLNSLGEMHIRRLENWDLWTHSRHTRATYQCSRLLLCYPLPPSTTVVMYGSSLLLPHLFEAVVVCVPCDDGDAEEARHLQEVL